MNTVHADFEPHFRKSPVTDPWEPLYSRRRPDAVDMRFEVSPSHCNSRGFLHGGVLAALCDNVMGLSVGTKLGQQKANIVTVTLAIDYIGGAKIGDAILIEPRVLRAGGSTGFCEALVTCDGKIIARSNATFSVRIVERDK